MAPAPIMRIEHWGFGVEVDASILLDDLFGGLFGGGVGTCGRSGAVVDAMSTGVVCCFKVPGDG